MPYLYQSFIHNIVDFKIFWCHCASLFFGIKLDYLCFKLRYMIMRLQDLAVMINILHFYWAWWVFYVLVFSVKCQCQVLWNLWNLKLVLKCSEMSRIVSKMLQGWKNISLIQITTDMTFWFLSRSCMCSLEIVIVSSLKNTNFASFKTSFVYTFVVLFRSTNVGILISFDVLKRIL